MPSFNNLFPNEDLLEKFAPAIQAYRAARRDTLALYEGVEETLVELKRQGVVIAAYTESLAYYSSYRFRKLKLDGLIDVLYSPPDHSLPEGESKYSIRSMCDSTYSLNRTRHVETPKGELKPNPQLLLDIISELGMRTDSAVYIGDSLVKDVSMAQDAGVLDVFAAYGASHSKEEYQLLVKVTHWTDEDVAREAQINERDVEPTLTIKNSFSEIMDLVRFG